MSTTWPCPVRRTPRRASIAAFTAYSDVTWAANCTGVAGASGGRSGKPIVMPIPADAHATSSEPFQSWRGPVSPNGDTATTTWRSWAGSGDPAPGSTSVITTSAVASSSSRAALPGGATTERLPWPKNAHHSDVSSSPGANGGRWRSTCPSAGSATTTSAPSPAQIRVA